MSSTGSVDAPSPRITELRSTRTRHVLVPNYFILGPNGAKLGGKLEDQEVEVKASNES